MNKFIKGLVLSVFLIGSATAAPLGSGPLVIFQPSTSSGGGGSGCIPGGILGEFLYDDGSGGCQDTSALITDGSTVTSSIFANSALALLGSSTGKTTIVSDNAGATDYTMHLVAADDTIATLAAPQILTNKTINAANNTLSNIPNSALTNSSVTIGSTSINLGASSTVLAGLSSVTSTTFVGSLTGTATNATNGATVATTTNASFFPLFVASSTNGNQAFNLGTGLTFNPSTNTLTATTFVGSLTGTASGNLTASSTATLTNKTFDTAGTGNSFSINGLAATANTGTGSVVRATSPTLVTPNLGTPSAIVLTSGTGLPISTGVTGLGTGVATLLSGASSGTGGPAGTTSPSITTPTITGAIGGDALQTSYLSSQFDKTNTTFSASGLQATLTTGGTYVFHAVLYLTNNGTGGAKVELAGSSTCSSVIVSITDQGGSSGNYGEAAATTTTILDKAGSAMVSPDTWIMDGSCVASAGGTLTIALAQHSASGTSSMLVGSYMTTTRAN